MTGKKLLDLWVNFLFEKRSPIPIALFRIIFGLLVLQSALIHVGDCVLLWYGPHAVCSPESVRTYWWWNQPHLDLFLLFPETDAGTLAVWYLYVTATVLLTVGLFTQPAAIIVCLCLISLHNHQPFNINGGDSMLRLYSGYLIFSRSGAALSVDRLMQRFRNPTFGVASTPPLIEPWGQRMIQLQLAIAYCSTFFHKLNGTQWLDGTAVYYATRLDDMMRNPVPWLYNNSLFCKLMTWYTLIVEGAMFTLVWLKEFKYYVLASTAILHLGIDYSINLPVFEWAFMAGFLTFVEPSDFTKSADFLKTRITIGFGPGADFTYNPNNKTQTAWASVLEGMDIFGRLKIGASQEGDHSGLVAKTSLGQWHGFKLFCWLTGQLPLLYPLYPLFGLPLASLCRTSKSAASEGA